MHSSLLVRAVNHLICVENLISQIDVLDIDEN